MSILKIYLDGFCTNLLSNTVPLTYTIIDLQKSKNLLPHIEITFYLEEGFKILFDTIQLIILNFNDPVRKMVF